MSVKKKKSAGDQKDLIDQKDAPPTQTIAQNLSQHDTQALLIGFGNPDDHAGIATLSMDAETITFPPPRKLCHDLLAYSALETSLSLQPYWNKHLITRSAVKRWRQDPYFMNCHDLAKERIGVRREQRFINDPGRMYASMPIYSADYQELKEWEAKLSDKSSDAPTSITIKVDRSTSNEHGRQTDRRSMQPPVGDTAPSGEVGDETEGSQEPEESTL